MKKLIIAILVAALVLFGASYGLQGVGAQRAQAEHLRLLKTILPGSESFAAVPYDGEDAIIRSVHKGETGYVIETVSYGYAGDITVLVGVNFEGKITGLVVRDLSETWGLGAKALYDTDFLAQFLNTSGGVTVGTPGQTDAFSGATAEAESEAEVYADAITGATVTSKAIARCVNSAAAYVTGADAVSAATSWGG
jgi:electron transport complex protein RnfG